LLRARSGGLFVLWTGLRKVELGLRTVCELGRGVFFFGLGKDGR